MCMNCALFIFQFRVLVRVCVWGRGCTEYGRESYQHICVLIRFQGVVTNFYLFRSVSAMFFFLSIFRLSFKLLWDNILWCITCRCSLSLSLRVNITCCASLVLDFIGFGKRKTGNAEGKQGHMFVCMSKYKPKKKGSEFCSLWFIVFCWFCCNFINKHKLKHLVVSHIFWEAEEKSHSLNEGTKVKLKDFGKLRFMF